MLLDGGLVLWSSKSPKQTEEERDVESALQQCEVETEGDRVEASSSRECGRLLDLEGLAGSQGLGNLGGRMPVTAAWMSCD
mmetsp:Transcript_94069/g.280749  ORF Transcript_94069/g.280749 Transcript_94069/m.280749 type:complete len:81 (+) Transcript_94069:115-357(+)